MGLDCCGLRPLLVLYLVDPWRKDTKLVPSRPDIGTKDLAR